MAEHDRLQLFHCSRFLNGAIWMKLWLELSFTTRHSGMSACQKDTSWKLPENRQVEPGRSLSSNERACGFTACISWSGQGWVLRGRWQQQASHFYQRLYRENKRLSSKNRTTMRVYDMISYGDNKSWLILIMTPLAPPPRTHHHLSLPRSFVNTPRPARPAGCQMELTRSQPVLSLLSPVALEGKPSSEAKAMSPQQISLLCHSAGTSVFVSERVRLSLCLRRLSAGLLLRVILSEMWSDLSVKPTLTMIQTLQRAQLQIYCKNQPLWHIDIDILSNFLTILLLKCDYFSILS